MTDTPNERTLKIALETFTELANTLKRERDEAREAIRALAEHGESEIQRITKERDKWAELCGQYKQERDEAKQDAATYRARIVEVTDGRELAREQEQIHYDNYIIVKKERDEAREALKHIEEYGTEEINSAVELRQKLTQALVDLDNVQDQRDLAMKIIKRLEQERDEAREIAKEADGGHDMAIADLAKCEAEAVKVVVRANELIARWDQPSWKDTAPTARYINALRIAVRAYEDAK